MTGINKLKYTHSQLLQAIMVCDMNILQEVVKNKQDYKLLLNTVVDEKTLFHNFVDLCDDFTKIKGVLLDLLDCVDFKVKARNGTNVFGYVLRYNKYAAEILLLDYFKDNGLTIKDFGVYPEFKNLDLVSVSDYKNEVSESLFSITRRYNALSLYWLDLLDETIHKEIIKNDFLMNVTAYNNVRVYEPVIKDIKKNKRKFENLPNTMLKFLYVLDEVNKENDLLKTLGFVNSKNFNARLTKFEDVWNALEKKMMLDDANKKELTIDKKSLKI